MDCVQPLYTLFNRHMQYAWVIEGDIRACFDTIPHKQLVAEVARRVADKRVLALILRFLKRGVMVGVELVPSEEGTPQGGIVSPLLANIYLHRFDAWFVDQYTRPSETSKETWRKERVKGGTKAAAQMFRYADEWIILVRGTKHQARDSKERGKQFFQEELGLELSEEKTAITHITEGFDFLGYRIFRNTQPSDRRLGGTCVRPADKCLKRMKLKVKEMTSRRTLSDDAIRKMQAINATVRGWAAYYRAVNPMETFKELDQYVWLRLSIWFRKKHRTSPRKVQERFMHRREGPKGGLKDYAVWDEVANQWLWRYRAQETKLVYHRPSFKKHWPHPYLEPVKVEKYVLPTMKDVWTGITRAPIYEAARRAVLKRAQGTCERCGQPGKLYVHHKNRVGERERNVADNRPEMLEALCLACHVQEHRAEKIHRNKQRRVEAKAG